MNLRCPHCLNAFEIIDDSSVTAVTCPSCQSKFSVAQLMSVQGGPDDDETVALETALPRPGEMVAHFRIQEHLGTGGFGSVFSALDTRLQRPVALKIPRQAHVAGRQAEIFIREAQAAAQLNHANIVAVHEIGRDEKHVYIVSDLIKGRTLRQWIKESEHSQQECAALIATIARAIHQAHGQGVVHRDLKPTNILMDKDHQPHVTDFGLAKRDGPEEITVTVSGEVVGTPAYMSPEQALGRSEEVDGRTDVYSLGVILYEMLAGRRPFRGESALLIDEVIAGVPEPPSKWNRQLSADLEAICLKAMSREMAERFATAQELADDLDRFVAGDPTLTRPPGPLGKLARTARKHVAAMGVVFLVLGLLGVTFFFPRSPAQVSAPAGLTVRFDVIPARADVAIVKVDFDTGRVDFEQVMVPSRDASESYTIDLQPGWYIVEAHHPNFGIQEVWRRVPRSLDERRQSNHLHCNWTPLGDGAIQWQPIRVSQTGPGSEVQMGPESMVRIKGGTFEAGSPFQHNMDQSLRRPLQEVTLDAFLCGQTEVTAGRYRQVIGNLPLAFRLEAIAGVADDAVLTRVTFFEALEYCERVGGRLPTFDEYVFAATDCGQSRFPWSDDAARIKSWEVTFPKEPAYDKTTSGEPIYNLFSSALEWTQEFNLPLDLNGKPWQVPTGRLPLEPADSRLVVGGPSILLQSLTKLPSSDQIRGPRAFFDLHPDTSSAVVGFRVVRSLTPRIGKAIASPASEAK